MDWICATARSVVAALVAEMRRTPAKPGAGSCWTPGVTAGHAAIGAGYFDHKPQVCTVKPSTASARLSRPACARNHLGLLRDRAPAPAPATMRVMRLALLHTVLFVAVLGCGATPPAAPRQSISEADARSIAERKGRDAGYSLDEFRVVSVKREQEGSSKGSWRVFLEHVPPTPPGGHFTVHVDDTSGDARLVHGR